MNTKDYIFVIYPFLALLQVYNCELLFDAIYALPRRTYDCIAANSLYMMREWCSFSPRGGNWEIFGHEIRMENIE